MRLPNAWNEQKVELASLKEIYYSDDVRSKLDFNELAIAKMFLLMV